MYDFEVVARPDVPAPYPVSILDDNSQGSWSSLVGIITAIIGNILISFALNTQRYAHIRIDKEYNDGLEEKKHGYKRLPKNARDYGTAAQQEQEAEERARINAEAPGPGNDGNDNTDAFGRRPRDRKGSYSSTNSRNSHQKNDNNQHDRKSYLKSPVWWVGIVLMAIGETGNFLAYGFAPASIVSPLGVVALISNCLIAPLMLKERFRKRDFWGVLIAIGGAVTVVLSAKTSETVMGPDDLWHAIKRWEFLTYIGITCVFIVALMVASPRYGKRTILIDLGLVGLFGGYTALSTKGVASMLSGSLWKALTFPITYALVAVLIISAIMQIRYINRALSNFNSTQVIPIQFVLFTLSVIIGSAVLYRDFEKTTLDRAIKFILGCALTFSGVWLITSGRKNNSDNNEDDEHDQKIQLIDEEAGMDDERTPLKREQLSKIDTGLDLQKQTKGESVDGTENSQPHHSPHVPSLSVTPYDEGLNRNPWVSSTEHLASLVRPRTPPDAVEHLDVHGTPFFTPGSAPGTTRTGRVGLLNRSESAPADPQTPTRGGRAPSPPKPDVPPIVAEEIIQTPQAGIIRTARGSFSRFLPGPFLGPLSSSSLTAVVAESLLNGEGSPQGPIRSRSYGRRTRPVQQSRTERNRRSSANGTDDIEEDDLESGPTTPALSRWQTRDSVRPSPGRRNTDGNEIAESSRTRRP